MQTFHFSTQPEQNIQIPLPDSSLHINGVLRGEWTQPLAILVHGLGCDNKGLLPFLLARTLAENGIASLRVNMYDSEPNTRDMIDCTVQTHAQDFDTIVTYVRNKNAPFVMAAGHSYGGLTILSSTAMLDAAVLLEPSHFKCSMEFDIHNKQERQFTAADEDIVVYESGVGRIDPTAMIQERKNKQNISETVLASKPYPLLFIAAEHCTLLPYIKQYFAAANNPKKLVVANGATHSLTDTDDIMLRVFDEVTSWFKTYVKLQ